MATFIASWAFQGRDVVAGAASIPRGPSSGVAISTSRAVIPQVNPAELGCDPAQVGIMVFSAKAVQRYGRVWQLGDMIGVSGREGVEKFYCRKLVGRAQIAAGNQTLRDVVWEYKGKFNLSAMDEDAWLTRKRLIMSHITSKGQAERYLQELDGLIQQTLAGLGSDGSPFSMHAACRRMLLQGFSHQLFGFSLQDYQDQTGNSIDEVTAAMAEMFTVFGGQQPATTGQMVAKDAVFAYLERALKMVRSDPGSFGWTSLGPYLADLEVQKLDDATIVMDMHKMLADGPYGLCTMNSMIIRQLAQHADIPKRVAEEANRILGTRPTSVEALRTMPYTFAVVKEALRWWPAAGAVPGVSLQEFEVEGFTIPANKTLMMCNHASLMDPTVYLDPDKFDPERFLPPRNEGTAGGLEGFMLAFGAEDSFNSHACGGKHVAVAFLLAFTARVCQAWKWRLCDPNEGFHTEVIGGGPKNGLQMQLSPVPQ
eukprot:jgi/Astpho2/7930/Aster-x0790